MRHLRIFGLVATAAVTLLAAIGASSASATELYKNTEPTADTLGKGTTIQASLKPETSFITEWTGGGGALHTCTSSEIAFEIEKAGGEATHPTGNVSTLSFTGCSHTTDVLAAGKLTIEDDNGTTNGRVLSSGLELELYSTGFGKNIVCKTGSGGTPIGTLTGAATENSHAVLDINAVMLCNESSTRLRATYIVTNPTGLIVEEGGGPETSPGTELYRNTEFINVTQGVNTVIEASLKSGSSLALKDTFGFTANKCTGSELGSKVESAGGEGSHPSGKVSSLTFSGCDHTFDVLANGSLEIKNIAGTTNGTVVSKGLELEVLSTLHETNIVCKAGTGITFGTLTGGSNGTHATIDVNAPLNCGPHMNSAKLTGTYVVTSPTGLVTEDAPNSGTELYLSTPVRHTQGVNIVIEGSLKSGTSLALADTFGSTVSTCTGSEITSKVESAGGKSSYPSGKVSSLTFSGCTGTFDVLAKGELEFRHIPLTTNASVVLKGMELSVFSKVNFTNIVCKPSTIPPSGTLTGVNDKSHATLDINAVLNCGEHLSSAKLTGTYTITTPTGLNAEAS